MFLDDMNNDTGMGGGDAAPAGDAPAGDMPAGGDAPAAPAEGGDAPAGGGEESTM